MWDDVKLCVRVILQTFYYQCGTYEYALLRERWSLIYIWKCVCFGSIYDRDRNKAILMFVGYTEEIPSFTTTDFRYRNKSISCICCVKWNNNFFILCARALHFKKCNKKTIHFYYQKYVQYYYMMESKKETAHTHTHTHKWDSNFLISVPHFSISYFSVCWKFVLSW